ncbi:MAG TPA: hypothetical protein VG937_33890 [Polyangiaceae bacterium]|nr:hypothetical protein [Polyangiaceae bacterium]
MHRGDAVRRTSDAEITRPQNETPSDPALPAWHVHLELQPDELVTLHRLGFTGGALAWREGMPEWQPLRVGDSAPPSGDANDPSLEDSLPQPIPLTRRSASRSGSGSIPPLERPRALFGSGRQTIPPIANAMAVPRSDLLLPPPPPIEARGSAPELASTRVLKLVQPVNSEPASMSAVREAQQPPSIPPMSLEMKPRPAQRGVSSRAVWWGAAALVALSASNGALVSALLWSLRHDFDRPAAAGTRLAITPPAGSVSAPIGSACASPSSNTVAGSALGGGTVATQGTDRSGPVSVDQLPLVTRASTSERGASEHSASTDHARATLAANGNGAGRATASRKGSGRVLLAEDSAASPRRVDAAIAAAAGATSSGPIDRRALAQAVGRATGAAASCADGPQKGRVALTFSPSGSVQGVTLEQSFGEPGINSCVLRAMGRARVRAFEGEAVTVHKTVAW